MIYKVWDLYKKNGLVYIVTETDGYGGYTSIPLQNYVLKVTSVILKDGEVFTLEEIMKNQYDAFIYNKKIFEEEAE